MKQITIDNTVINNLYQFLKTTDADLPSRTLTRHNCRRDSRVCTGWEVIQCAEDGPELDVEMAYYGAGCIKHLR